MILVVLVVGLVDIGYFVFMDFGGYVYFVFGIVMILICVIVIVFSFFVMFGIWDGNVDVLEIVFVW